jgi:ADP-heptose:LPS heptosyltransferase
LLIRLDGNYEIEQTFPTISILKRQYPQSEIHFAVKKEYVEILSKIREIHRIHVLDKDEKFPLTALHDELAKEFFDLLIDLQCDFRTSYLYSCCPGAKKLFYSRTKHLLRKLFSFFKKNAKNNVPPLWCCFLNVLPRQDFDVLQADFETTNK